MMRLIIVVTTPEEEYKLWALSHQWESVADYCLTPVRMAIVGWDRVLMLCQSPGEGNNEKDVILSSRKKTTPWVVGVANALPFNNAKKIYVAAHDPYVSLRELPVQLSGRYAAGAYFHHETIKSQLFDELTGLCERRDPDSFEHVIEAIVHHQIHSRGIRFNQLKYKIDKVLASLAWNVDAMREVDFAEEYLIELSRTALGPERVLDSIRAILYQQSDSPEKDTVETIVREIHREKHANWRRIETLLPRSESAIPFVASTAYSLVESFGKLHELKNLKTKLLAGENPLTEWTDQFELALSNLAEGLD
jgi:hypothetical protein